ncbi:MAG: phosphoribosyltransferase family protein, partial [Gammaproteobacteria bacterium]
MDIPKHIREVYSNAVCLYSKQEVEQALDKLAGAVHNKLADSNPLLLCVMVGGLIPTGGLLSRIDFPLELDYVLATRYTGQTRGGIVSWKNKQ